MIRALFHLPIADWRVALALHAALRRPTRRCR
ncbi:hypothetical protein RISW2_14690 [Roseivivax isoporae LMG 25204]|uniref:Uncharacterized protein n=1 Tax=Roseivivax isoporae LMG 25204 TaxID=1449351 RepID=X7F5G0_9RHOB|nr:hypothetical protein RISW2_14690 [Roseivivax isoporae LMG 25204]